MKFILSFQEAENSIASVIIVVVLGLPIGYLINQVATFVFHFIPSFGFHSRIERSNFLDRTVPGEAKKEMEIYEMEYDVFKKDFNIREWFSWRWTHLTINYNILVAIVLSFIVAVVVNGTTEGRWYPIYSLRKGFIPVVLATILGVGILIANIRVLYFFLRRMYKKILKDE